MFAVRRLSGRYRTGEPANYRAVVGEKKWVSEGELPHRGVFVVVVVVVFPPVSCLPFSTFLLQILLRVNK